MPASDDFLHNGRVLAVLFWSGVGLAPLAALILLVGQSGGPLRFGAIFALIAVVLIGLSIGLRRDADSVRAEVHEALHAEVTHLRGEVRADITTAARNTYYALTERLAEVTHTVDALRSELDEVQSQAIMPTPDQGAVAGGPAAPGIVRHTETVHVTHRTTLVDASDNRGTIYGSRAAREPDQARVSGGGHPDDEYADEDREGRRDRSRPDDRDPERHRDDRGRGDRGGDEPPRGRDGDERGYRGRGRSESSRSGEPVREDGRPRGRDDRDYRDRGDVRHADDRPYRDGAGHRGGPDFRYDPDFRDGAGAREDARYRDRADDRSRDARSHDRDDSRHHGEDRYRGDDRYGEDRYRGDDRYGDDRHRDDRYGDDRHRDDRHRDEPESRRDPSRVREPDRTRGRDHREPEPYREPSWDQRWEAMASGGRWASVRSDDQGHELRIGERRSAVRSDGRGTELRVEDRWAALRRDEPIDAPYRADGDWEISYREGGDPASSAPALPAAPGEPAWAYTSDPRERESRGGSDRTSGPRSQQPVDHERDERRR
jgi:hypothetical protein